MKHASFLVSAFYLTACLVLMSCSRVNAGDLDVMKTNILNYYRASTDVARANSYQKTLATTGMKEKHKRKT